MPFEPPHALHSRLLFLAEADIDHFLEDKLSWEVFLEQLPTGSLRMEMSYNMIHNKHAEIYSKMFTLTCTGTIRMFA